MQNTTKFREHDLVELLEDLPEYQVRRGEVGVVVEVFDSPNEASTSNLWTILVDLPDLLML